MDASKRRLRRMMTFFLLIILLIAARIVWFRISNPSGRTVATEIIRGRIEDANGITLAYTKESSTIALAPKEIYDDEQLADILAPYLRQEPLEILHRIYQKKNYDYFYLRRQIDNLTANLILEKKLPGVYREYELKRVYPGLTLASNVIGFVGRDQEVGLEGLERDYNEVLNDGSDTPRGNVLQLTIDSVVQKELDAVMQANFLSSGSKRGVGIMMDLRNGDILALSSLPNFDPNEYYKYTNFERANWSSRFSFEPGSTVKILMAAVLLAEKAITRQQRFECNGILHFSNASIRCRVNNKITAHGMVNLADILRYSCNVGMIKAMQKISPESLYDYLQKMGIGQSTNTFPYGSGELSGYFPNISEFVPSSMYYIPIGQSFTMTALQLLKTGATVILENKRVEPTIVKRILNSNKTKVLEEFNREAKEGLIAKEISRTLRQMMRQVVVKGTGRAANIAGLSVIGKTGTGEKSNAKGYLDKYVVSFLGFFPQAKPRYGVLILFDEPSAANATGGSIAAPAFRQFVSKIRPYIQIQK